MTNIVSILTEAHRLKASDVHFIADNPVMIRVNGELIPLPEVPPLDAATCLAMIYELLSPAQRARYESELSVDASFAVGDVRYRVSVTLQRQGVEAVCRVIPNAIPSPEDLLLPPSVVRLSELKRGMVLVTGPTGSGKSTTLASLVERINQTRRAKIITLEDPIEFLHVSKYSVISQREVGQHTQSFSRSLREILRQDPDVVLVGEMRDYETMDAALQVADTGHLVLATLHSIDAPQAVERIIDVFPAAQQPQIRTQLASNLRAVIAQSLIPRVDKPGRVGAYEVMIVTPGIATMIRQGRNHEIASAIEMGSKDGMLSMNRSLLELVKQRIIDPGYGQGAPVKPSPSSHLNAPVRENPERRRPI